MTTIQSSTRGMVILLLLCAGMARARAQDTYADHPETYAIVQDTVAMNMTVNGVKLRRNEFSGAYVFDMVYDSICRVGYTFTECQRNDTLLKLMHWVYGRRVNADQVLLSFNSTTDTFTCHVGDTLSFYRELKWVNPTTGQTALNNYYALDSLDYAVELVRLSDSLRAAQLDTIGILDNPVPGRPRVHGTHPLLARVNYVVPMGLNGQKAFIRVLVYHRGPGKYWFSRTEDIIVAWSRRLNDTNLRSFYNKIFRALPAKRSLDELTGPLSSSDGLSVTQPPGTGEAVITFASAPKGTTTVAVYDALGNVLFYPYSTPESSGEIRTCYRFERSGVYFIALLYDGRLVATQRITMAL